MTDLHWLYLRRNSSLVGVFFPAPVENSVCWACAMNLSEQNLCLICWHYWSCEMDSFFPYSWLIQDLSLPSQHSSICKSVRFHNQYEMWCDRHVRGQRWQTGWPSQQSHPAIHAEQDDFSSCDGESVWSKWKLWKRSLSRFTCKYCFIHIVVN